jgi:hypothetical protein
MAWAGSAPGETGSERPRRSTRCPVNRGGSPGYRPNFEGPKSVFRASGRERPVVKLGVEGPDVEVLDAVLPVHVVDRSALAQGPAQQAAGIAAGTLRVVFEELGLGIGGQRGKAQKVSYVDTGQRPIQVLEHGNHTATEAGRSMRCRNDRFATRECAHARHRGGDTHDGKNANDVMGRPNKRTPSRRYDWNSQLVPHRHGAHRTGCSVGGLSVWWGCAVRSTLIRVPGCASWLGRLRLRLLPAHGRRGPHQAAYRSQPTRPQSAPAAR